MSITETLATKHNQGKPKLSLLPHTFFEWYSEHGSILQTLSRMAHSSSPLEYEGYLGSCLFHLCKRSDSLVYGLAEVMEFGANKYNRNNWKKGFVWSEMIDAAMRHAYQSIEKDPESGLHHWKHLAFCIVMLHYMFNTNTGVNDLEWNSSETS